MSRIHQSFLRWRINSLHHPFSSTTAAAPPHDEQPQHAPSLSTATSHEDGPSPTFEKPIAIKPPTATVATSPLPLRQAIQDDPHVTKEDHLLDPGAFDPLWSSFDHNLRELRKELLIVLNEVEGGFQTKKKPISPLQGGSSPPLIGMGHDE